MAALIDRTKQKMERRGWATQGGSRNKRGEETVEDPMSHIRKRRADACACTNARSGVLQEKKEALQESTKQRAKKCSHRKPVQRVYTEETW